MPGLAHCFGRESGAVGICEALTRKTTHDTHRGHGATAWLRATPDRDVCRALGRSTVLPREGARCTCRSRPRQSGANAIVAEFGIATGAAFSAKHLGTGVLRFIFVRGAGRVFLYEVMNLAQCGNCRDLCVENNMYNDTHISRDDAGIFCRARRRRNTGGECGWAGRAGGSRTAQKVVDRARRGDGPSFLMCKHVSLYGTTSGYQRDYYRSKQEEQTGRVNRDPF